MELREDVLTHLDYVLRLDEGTILQAADDKQEDIFSQRLHLHTVYINPSDFEETSNILKYINKN